MTRQCRKVEEVIYTLSPHEVASAVRDFIREHRSEGQEYTGVVGPNSPVTILPDGSATCVNRYVETGVPA